jgi:hypothetical protein
MKLTKGADDMFVSEPISALTNYNKVLSAVDEGKEVVLTKNGVAKYTVVDAEFWQYSKSMLRFLADMRAVDEEIENGGASYSVDELRAALGLIKQT